jgi:predicted permease
MSLFTRLFNLGSTTRIERDIDEEQQFHLDARIDELVRGGLSQEEAEAQALRQFGGRLRQREASRDVRLLPWLEALAGDVRHGVRLLRRDPGVTTAAVLSLALAIGAGAGAFSLVDALMLRPLPVAEPDRLIYLARGGRGDDQRLSTLFSYPHFERFRDTAAGQAAIFSCSFQSLRSSVLPDSRGQEERLRVQFLSGNALSELGVRAALGRLLTPADDLTRGGHPVVVVSHAFWTRRFAADPSALGKWIAIEREPFQIVGVAQAGFTGVDPGILTDVFVPNMMWRGEAAFTNPEWNWLRVWGRLAPGLDREVLAPKLQATYALIEREIAAPAPPTPPGVTPPPPDHRLSVRSAATGPSAARQMFGPPLLVLAAVVALVLLIACTNIANLMVARGAARGQEMALRASIGAGRGRLVQQLLIEGGVLTAAAIVPGLLFARVATPAIVAMLTTANNSVYLDTSIDLRAAAFVVALGGLTTLLFALMPALRVSRVARTGLLSRTESRHTAGAFAQRVLVALQVGFSLMVLVVAGLLLQSFDRLNRVDLGFSPQNVTLVTMEARDEMTRDVALEAAQQILDSVRRIPGVDDTSLSGWALFRGISSSGNFQIPGRGRVQTQTLSVSPGFFRTMGIGLRSGREFERRDLIDPDVASRNVVGVSTVALVNEAFARRYFPGMPAIGQRVNRVRDHGSITFEIIGVTANARDAAIRGDVGPYLYQPLLSPDSTLQVRSPLEPAVLTDRLREILPRIHPSLRLVQVDRQSALVAAAMVRERLLAVLSGFFAGVGLALAAVGLYGVASYAVVRRTREIGIRLALGARPASIVRPVLGGIAIALAAGAIVGLTGGLMLARFVRTLLFEIEPFDPSNMAISLGVLALVAAIAAWRPARRATRVDPVVALRSE